MATIKLPRQFIQRANELIETKNGEIRTLGLRTTLQWMWEDLARAVNSNQWGSLAVTSVTHIAFADSPYTVTTTDEFILADSTGGAIVVTLPNIADDTVGRQITVKKIDTGANSVTLSGDATIDNAASYVFNTPYASVTVQSDGLEWWIR
jgi:hypothetical protein